MSGVIEILLIVVIVLGILLLPRLTGRKRDRDFQLADHGFRMTGWMRIAIMASFVWPVLVALFLKPWNNNWPAFLYVGVGPVALIWGISWVFLGFRKERK
ncbi:MAG: hypothetical protein ISS61_06995 [Desulfobacteraceae bacterium]|nr:hypothetical protein [Desulfobacteraceae bacterium]